MFQFLLKMPSVCSVWFVPWPLLFYTLGFFSLAFDLSHFKREYVESLASRTIQSDMFMWQVFFYLFTMRRTRVEKQRQKLWYFFVRAPCNGIRSSEMWTRFTVHVMTASEWHMETNCGAQSYAYFRQIKTYMWARVGTYIDKGKSLKNHHTDDGLGNVQGKNYEKWA